MALGRIPRAATRRAVEERGDHIAGGGGGGPPFRHPTRAVMPWSAPRGTPGLVHSVRLYTIVRSILPPSRAGLDPRPNAGGFREPSVKEGVVVRGIPNGCWRRLKPASLSSRRNRRLCCSRLALARPQVGQDNAALPIVVEMLDPTDPRDDGTTAV